MKPERRDIGESSANSAFLPRARRWWDGKRFGKASATIGLAPDILALPRRDQTWFVCGLPGAAPTEKSVGEESTYVEARESAQQRTQTDY